MKYSKIERQLLWGITAASLAFALFSWYHHKSPISAPRDADSIDSVLGNIPTRHQSSGEIKPAPPTANKSSEDAAKPGMTPEEAIKRLEEAALMTSIQHQARVYSEVMKGLCRAGYVSYAWDIMLDQPGLNRDSQIAAFFLNAPLSLKDCVEKITTFQDFSEKKIALKYYLSKNFNEYQEILENPDIKQITQDLAEVDSNSMAEIMGTALRTRFDESNDIAEKEKINQTLLDLHSEGLILDSDLAGMLVRNSTKDPFELWSWISDSSMGINEPQSFEGETRSAIVRGMVSHDAPEALTKIAANESAIHDLSQGLTFWAASDSREANEWYLNARPNLTSAQQDSAAGAFATLALKYSEFEGAEEWANRITNAEIRESVLAQIRDADQQTP